MLTSFHYFLLKFNICAIDGSLRFYFILFLNLECEQGVWEREPQAGSTWSAEPLVGLDPVTLRSSPEPKSTLDRSAHGAPQVPRATRQF